MRFNGFATPLLITVALTGLITAQQTNPVDRQVSNPITDTPNINPVSAEQIIAAPKPKKTGVEPEGGDGEVVVYSNSQTVEGEKGSHIVHHIGNVDVHYGIYRLQANDVTIYEAENKIVARGSVIFDQGNDQRITGASAVWNYKTKLGVFEDSTGFTNQTNDGTVIYFTADRVERVALNEIVVTNGIFTACEEAVPKWSFTAAKARIRTNDKLRLNSAKFRVKNVPLLIVPFASIPIKQKDRSSGFLTPTIGYSGSKGARLSTAYYKILGDSADVTFRGDIYTARGFGYGADVRTRANSRSFLNFGFFAVKDRVLGHGVDAEHPDQGGSTVYVDGIHYFPNGFTAAVDVRLTSSLDFRQEFSDTIQQVISPIEVSQLFINKSWNSYTLNFLARKQEISIPNILERTRNLPGIDLEKRPSELSFLRNVYVSFRAGLEGVSRNEVVMDRTLYSQMTDSVPVNTPSVVQRFDAYPEVTIPFHTKYFNFTASGAARFTYYSNSFDNRRRVVSTDLIRKYGEFVFDVRPVALAKNYYGKADKFKFRHVIEPYVTYRLVKGVDNFDRIIRFDYIDTATDTNEIEFGVINRIYTRRYGQAVTKDAEKKLQADRDDKNSLSVQPYEIFSLTVRGKYFFDESFGGALVPGRRNQIEPITALSFYTFGGVPRRWSPLNIDATYRPQKTVFANARLDYGMQGDGLRSVSSSVGFNTPMVKIFQTFYYTRAVTLMPSLAVPPNLARKEAGTLRGSQWSPSVFLGNRNRGLFGGTSFFFDFENRRATEQSPMISSLVTLGYAYDCCSVSLQYFTFNVGVRKENKFVFAFRLNSIGSFGTEQIGAGYR